MRASRRAVEGLPDTGAALFERHALYQTIANVLGGGKPVLTGPAIVTGKDVPKLE